MNALATSVGSAPLTIAAARRALSAAFLEAGLDAPDTDARLLLGHALALDRTALLAEGHRLLGEADRQTLMALAARRLHGEPVARILGRKEFWGLPLRVTAATLVPRPDTETVVEAALAAIGGTRDRPLRIADLGTGTGASLLALLSELPNALGIASDISPDALIVARGNAERLDLRARARFVACDFGAALADSFDLVVSNPPYIAESEIAALPAEVQYDPRAALDGGGDGLACYRAIVRDAPRLLAPHGHLVVELGIGQAEAVAALVAAAGLEPTAITADLAGVARALTARVAAKAP